MSAERARRASGHAGRVNEDSRDMQVMRGEPSLANIPAGLAVHAQAGMLVTLQYASCVWSAFFGGVREAQERSAKERP